MTTFDSHVGVVLVPSSLLCDSRLRALAPTLQMACIRLMDAAGRYGREDGTIALDDRELRCAMGLGPKRFGEMVAWAVRHGLMAGEEGARRLCGLLGRSGTGEIEEGGGGRRRRWREQKRRQRQRAQGMGRPASGPAGSLGEVQDSGKSVVSGADMGRTLVEQREGIGADVRRTLVEQGEESGADMRRTSAEKRVEIEAEMAQIRARKESAKLADPVLVAEALGGIAPGAVPHVRAQACRGERAPVESESSNRSNQNQRFDESESSNLTLIEDGAGGGEPDPCEDPMSARMIRAKATAWAARMASRAPLNVRRLEERTLRLAVADTAPAVPVDDPLIRRMREDPEDWQEGEIATAWARFSYARKHGSVERPIPYLRKILAGVRAEMRDCGETPV